MKALNVEKATSLVDAFSFPICIVNISDDFKITFANNAFYNLVEYSKEEMYYKFSNTLSSFFDRQTIMKINKILSIKKNDFSFQLEHTLHNKSGMQLWVLNEFNRLKSNTDYLYMAFTDVSKYKEGQIDIEKALKKSEFATNKLNIYKFEFDLEQHTAQMEKKSFLNNVFGDEINARDFLNSGLVHEDSIAVFKEAFDKLRRGEKEVSFEFQAKYEYKEFHWYKIYACIANEKEPNIVFGFLQSIHNEKDLIYRYLNETQYLESFLSRLTAYSQIDVSENKALRVGGLYETYEEDMHSLPFDDLVEKFTNQSVHYKDRKNYMDIVNSQNLLSSFQNGVSYFEVEFKGNDEEDTRWMKLYINLFKNPINTHVMGFIYLKDITERMKREWKQYSLSMQQDEDVKEKQSIESNVDTQTINQKDTVIKKHVVADDFDTLVGQYGEMAYLIDPETYNLVSVNQSFYDHILKEEKDVLGKKCYEVLHHRDSPCAFCVKANWSRDEFSVYRNYNEVLQKEFLIRNRLVGDGDKTKVLALAIELFENEEISKSLNVSVSENDHLLNGIQYLQDAKDFITCVHNTLESIGLFYHADIVRCWKYDTTNKQYRIIKAWSADTYTKSLEISLNDLVEIRNWHHTQTFQNVIYISSREQMLNESIEMFRLMLSHNIQNQIWFPFQNGDANYLFSIANCTTNFHNETFLNSFMRFVGKEWKTRRKLDEIVYETYHDKLTKVFNRSFYERQIALYEADKLESIAVVVANIDDFKSINSEHGFDFGNHCLLSFASLMKKAFFSDEIYRLSGDEFIIILKNVKQNNVEKKINKLISLIHLNCTFTASMGYAWDDVEKNISNLTELATNAMQANKKRFYDSVHFDNNKERVLALNGLLTSIVDRDFEVFVQAKYDIQNECVFGGEALVRFNHKEYGYIQPIKFIEQLEKNNMIRYVDLFVFEEVCKYVQKWRKEERKPIVLSFNLSRITLMEHDILETMESIFSQYDIDKQDIEVEITENDTSVGKAILFQNARKLHEAGYRISLDDFGTNHTNLNILSDIEVDVLKVDKSLIHSLSKNTKKQFILKNVIQMCRDLNISVVAEGVENKEQEDILKKLHCRLIQGYLYSKPIPIDEFEKTFL